MNEAVGPRGGRRACRRRVSVSGGHRHDGRAKYWRRRTWSLPGQEVSAAHAALNRGARLRSFEVADHAVPKSDIGGGASPCCAASPPLRGRRHRRHRGDPAVTTP